MWIIKLHIAVSILSLISFYGFFIVCKEQIKKNGWMAEKKKRKLVALLAFFVPIMNVLMVLLLFVMIGVKQEEFEQLTEYVKKESEEK